MQNASKPTGKEYRSKGKVITLSSTNNIFPHLYHFDPTCTKLNIFPWFIGKIASHFVSLIMSISILPPMIDESTSDLFPLEFILRCTIIIFFEILDPDIIRP